MISFGILTVGVITTPAMMLIYVSSPNLVIHLLFLHFQRLTQLSRLFGLRFQMIQINKHYIIIDSIPYGVNKATLIEKIGMLRRDMQHKGDLDKYDARMARIAQKFAALAEAIADSDPALATSLRAAWQLPARSLAFRNAEHRKKA